jgi:hypothetical protein
MKKRINKNVTPCLTKKQLSELYRFVGEFCEGLAHVISHDGRHLHIHPDGRPAYEHWFDLAGPFKGGKAPVEKRGTHYHIGRNGRPID